MKKVAHATEESGTLVGGIASHLQHPLGCGMFGQTGEADAARCQLNEDGDQQKPEWVQGSQRLVSTLSRAGKGWKP